MRKLNKKIVIIGAVIIMLMPLTITLVNDYINSKKVKEDVPTSTLTIKEKIENSIIMDNKKEVKFNEVNKILIVDLNLRKGPDNESRWMLAQEDIFNILKKSMKNIEYINEVLITFDAEFEDKYGNKSDNEVYRLRYKAEEINKINFETIDYLKIDKLSSDVFMHPEFSK